MSFFHKIKRDGITILYGIHDSLFQLDNMATRTHLVHLSCTWLSHSLLVVHARLTHPCTHRSRYHTVHIDLTLYTSLKSGHTSHSESTDETTDDFPHVFPKRSRLVKTIYVWWWVTTKNATKGERGYEDFTPSVSTPKYGYHARATAVRFVCSRPYQSSFLCSCSSDYTQQRHISTLKFLGLFRGRWSPVTFCRYIWRHTQTNRHLHSLKLVVQILQLLVCS